MMGKGGLSLVIHLVETSAFKQRRQWQPIPVLLPGKSHGWRSLVGYSPWGRKESDMTERLHFHFVKKQYTCGGFIFIFGKANTIM